jgi:hypothetical protein
MGVIGQKATVGVTFQFLLAWRPVTELSGRYSASKKWPSEEARCQSMKLANGEDVNTAPEELW